MLKEAILQKSLIGKSIDEDELQEFINTSLTNETDAANLPIAERQYLGQAYMIKGIQYVCEEPEDGPAEWVAYNTAGQALHYPDASGKPTLDGITFNGALTKAALGIAPDIAERTTAPDPTGMDILLDDDKKITYDDLAALLQAAFGISTLPKYEKQNNPLLTSDGTYIKWIITHTCKTSEPLVQMFTKEGDLINYSTIALNNLTIRHLSSNEVEVEWNNAIDIAANEYYVVLIG